MGLQLKKETGSSQKQIWQRVDQLAQGGFTIDAAGFTGTILAGAPVLFNEETRVAKILKLAEIFETAGSVTSYKIAKGHNLAVGDHVSKTVGGAAYTITAINTTNAAYDTITVGTTIGAVTAGEAIFKSSASGASAGALDVAPNGLLYDDVTVGVEDSVAVVLRGTVYAKRIPAVPASAKTGMPHIIFSNSF